MVNIYQFLDLFPSPLEQLNQSQEKFKLLSSEKEENQLKVLTLVKERDDFAQLALQRGKTLEVSNFQAMKNKAISEKKNS